METRWIRSGAASPYCKGCGHELVLRAVGGALAETRLQPSDVVVVTDIGCVGLADSQFESPHTVHTTHGRSTAFAVGMALSDAVLGAGRLRPIVLVGDGGAMIGLNHLVNAALLNANVTVLVHNNFLFGMTGGQNSAFSPVDFVTATTMEGNAVPPLDLARVMIASRAPFVARKIAADRDLASTIARAIAQPGFALVEILELCTGYATRWNPLTGARLREVAAAAAYDLGILHDEPRPSFAASYAERHARSQRPAAPGDDPKEAVSPAAAERVVGPSAPADPSVPTGGDRRGSQQAPSAEAARAGRRPASSDVPVTTRCEPSGARPTAGIEAASGGSGAAAVDSPASPTVDPPRASASGTGDVSPSGRYDHGLKGPVGVVLAGTAGERVQTAATLLANAAMLCGLNATQKNDNPVTQGTGFSLAEVVISPEPILYTGLEQPDALLVVSQEGAREVAKNGFIDRLGPGAWVLSDSEVDLDVRDRPFAAAPLRREAGPKLAALAAVAAWLAASEALPLESLWAAIERRFGREAGPMLETLEKIREAHFRRGGARAG